MVSGQQIAMSALSHFFKNYMYIFNKLTTASLQHLTNVWKVSERVNSPHIGLLYKLLKVRKDFNQVWGWAIVLKDFSLGGFPENARLLLIALDVGLSSCCQYDQRPFNQFILSWQEEDQITKLEHIAKKNAKISAKHSPKLHFRIFNIPPITTE